MSLLFSYNSAERPPRAGCVKTRCGAKPIEWVFIRSRLAELKFSRAGDFDRREKYHSHLRLAFGVFTQPARGRSLRNPIRCFGSGCFARTASVLLRTHSVEK